MLKKQSNLNYFGLISKTSEIARVMRDTLFDLLELSSKNKLQNDNLKRKMVGIPQ